MENNLQHIDFQVQNQIAMMGLDMQGKGVNLFTSETISEFFFCIRKIASLSDVDGLIIYSKKSKQFIAGASIDEIAAVKDPSVGADLARMGQDLMQSIENLKIPVVAAINGPCMGGGLEMALACSYRIATDDEAVRLQLPEVQLGILPGFGGTQRLPQWVGLMNSLDLILTGRPLDAKKALKIGLIDDITPEPLLIETAKKWIAIGKRKPFPFKQKPILRMLESLQPVQRLIFSRAKKSILQKTSGHYPAPLQALDVISKTFGKVDHFTYDLEAQKLGSLVASPICKALINLYLATENIKKTTLPLPPQPISKTAVLGAGVMGAGIAHLLAKKDKEVRIKEVSFDAIEKGIGLVLKDFEKEGKRKRLPYRFTQNKMHRISFTTSHKGFQKSQMVIEAIVENLAIKQEVLSHFAKHVSQDTIIATNTSALSISQIAQAIDHPERVIGLHFFNPVSKMPLVEIIQGEQTSQQTISTAYSFAIGLGKVPILVADRPGFLVNRILGLYLAESASLVQEGFSVEEVDCAMKNFGMPMGPFELLDEVGIDVANHVGKFLSESFHYFPNVSNLLMRLIESNRLGKKNGLGFYKHKGSSRTLDTAYIKSLGLVATNKTSNEKNERHIIDRLVLLMANEAYRCLEEKVVQSEQDVDVGMVLGTGFAPFRGGLIQYTKSRNLDNVKTTLSSFAAKHGKHFEPCQALVEQSYR